MLTFRNDVFLPKIRGQKRAGPRGLFFVIFIAFLDEVEIWYSQNKDFTGTPPGPTHTGTKRLKRSSLN